MPDLALNYEQIWEDAKEILKEKIPNNTFEPWILPIIPAKNNEECFKKDHIVLKSDKSFGVSFLNQKYLYRLMLKRRQRKRKNLQNTLF